MTTGEIERKTPYEKVTGFYTLLDNRFIADHLVDDQSLILHHRDKGLIIICGCAHSGLINTIAHAQHIMKTDTIYAVIGGFHLKNATPQRIDATTQALRELDLKLIAPCHCTGSKAIQQLTSIFGKYCHPLCVGDSLRL
jgi:7,8-dihydropterin-6-yl-methyl-4-(beta-D-ribofuranosyl)aminobenzene 5'-phosphate synthase